MPFFTEPTEAECFEAEQELLFDVHFRQLDREIKLKKNISGVHLLVSSS